MDNLVEDIDANLELQFADPYVLYRNKEVWQWARNTTPALMQAMKGVIHGIWFAKEEERNRIQQRMTR